MYREGDLDNVFAQAEVIASVHNCLTGTSLTACAAVATENGELFAAGTSPSEPGSIELCLCAPVTEPLCAYC